MTNENSSIKDVSYKYWSVAESILGYNQDIDAFSLLAGDNKEKSEQTEDSMLKTENSFLDLKLLSCYNDVSVSKYSSLPYDVFIQIHEMILADNYLDALSLTNEAILKHGKIRELLDLQGILEKKGKIHHLQSIKKPVARIYEKSLLSRQSSTTSSVTPSSADFTVLTSSQSGVESTSEEDSEDQMEDDNEENSESTTSSDDSDSDTKKIDKIEPQKKNVECVSKDLVPSTSEDQEEMISKELISSFDIEDGKEEKEETDEDDEESEEEEEDDEDEEDDEEDDDENEDDEESEEEEEDEEEDDDDEDESHNHEDDDDDEDNDTHVDIDDEEEFDDESGIDLSMQNTCKVVSNSNVTDLSVNLADSTDHEDSLVLTNENNNIHT